MRHLGSLVLTALFAPAIYVLTGIGMVKYAAATAPTDPAGRMAMASAAGALVAAGILYAILTVSRMSPIGPFLAGLGFAAVSAASLLAHPGVVHRVPYSVLGMHGVLTRPAAMAAVLAVPLIATAFSPVRWRRDADEDDESPYSSYRPDPFQSEPYPAGSTFPETYEEPFRGYR